LARDSHYTLADATIPDCHLRKTQTTLHATDAAQHGLEAALSRHTRIRATTIPRASTSGVPFAHL
jgi:hypothetical protein